jgi:hypothetical protein
MVHKIAQLIRALPLGLGLTQDREGQGDRMFADGMAKQSIGT